MSNPLERRIARLEALRPPKSDKIPIFVMDEEEVPQKIDEMIAAGQIAEADWERCVWWLAIKPRREWLREWEDNKLLAAEEARQKDLQEKRERYKAERAGRQQGADTAPQNVAPQTAAHQPPPEPATEQQAVELPPAGQHTEQAAEAPPAEQQSAEQQTTAHADIDLSGTVPPGCLN